MASTLGVLDVLSRLREESERADTALAAQEDTNRALTQRCSEAEEESGRSVAVIDALEHHKSEIEKSSRVAEARRLEAVITLKRLEHQHERREESAAREREAARATANAAIASSQKFRSDASAKVLQMGELRTRLREKRTELNRIRDQALALDGELQAKVAVRDKVRAEMTARREQIASGMAKAKEAEQENERTLATARQVEAEAEEARAEHDEIHEMATGLQRRNQSLRNELRFLKRKLDGDVAQSSPRYNTGDGIARPWSRGGSTGLAASRDSGLHRQQQQHQQQQQTRRGTSVERPFTIASSLVMPQLRLSSPHPGSRRANFSMSTPIVRNDDPCGDKWQHNHHGQHRAVSDHGSAADGKDGGGTFEYHA